MTLLLLAGTGDAFQIAEAIKDKDVIASLAGATRQPKALPVPTRTGGFGGRDGFCDYLDRAGISAVLDATHPYAARITRRTAEVCRTKSIPYMQFLRPGWTATPGDKWCEVAKEEDAASHIPMGAAVFLGTGRQTLDRFANLEGRRVICRQIDPPDGLFPFKGGEFLVGRPPFSVEDEVDLFSRLSVDWLIVKNAGGVASRTKLTAAAQLGIPVLMIARPQRGNWPCVRTVEDAINWARAQ